MKNRINVKTQLPPDNVMCYVWHNGIPYAIEDSNGQDILMPMISEHIDPNWNDSDIDFIDFLAEESVLSTDGYEPSTDTLEYVVIENYTVSMYKDDVNEAGELADQNDTEIYDEFPNTIRTTKIPC